MDGILCDEVLEEVFRRLPFPSSAADVSLVSKRWLRFCRSSMSDVSLRLSVDNCTPPSLSSFLSHFPFLKITTATLRSDGGDISGFRYRILSLDDISAFADQILLSVASSCPKQQVSVSRLGRPRRSGLTTCRPIVDEILTILAENCASLSSVLVYNGGGREGLRHFITQSRRNLQKLDLCLPHDLRDNHLLAVAEKFRGLLSLRLDSCYRVTGEGLKTMALAMSDKLEELALINCNMKPGLLTTLGHSFTNLRNLDLSYNDMLTDEEFILMLSLFNCLRELKVRGSRGLTNASVVSMFKRCKQLESVDIMNCPRIEAKAVELVVLNCLRLKQIHVEESKLSDVSRSWASKKFVEVIVD
ncbi:hypothetical protein RHMOL_Rhmol08G0058200 [Rhododendron molle]|uniref:Uncharacterized protein n=1 Tax=Rhododendron molle TaxID=49168 RepID=A0ACC0MKJ5_RHOML|nr:hypothetical protein RHMOL_Rhmol08G0058200 [Rhododendron molle]